MRTCCTIATPIFSADLDESIRKRGAARAEESTMKSQGERICERVIGTIRRECLDWIISALGIALASDAEILGGALQLWTPAFGLASRRSRSSRDSTGAIVQVAAPTRRLLLGSCQSNTRRIAPRVLTGARVKKSTAHSARLPWRDDICGPQVSDLLAVALATPPQPSSRVSR